MGRRAPKATRSPKCSLGCVVPCRCVVARRSARRYYPTAAMQRIHVARLALAAFAALLVLDGCTPKIGRECVTSLDCSQQADRICDNTQPDGYCTLFNCEPDKCPEGDGVCVAFSSQVDPACGSTDDVSWGRFERTYCMANCESNDDCRTGYECAKPSTRDGRIIDFTPVSDKICVVKIAAPPVSTQIPEVCRPPAVDFDLTPYTPPDAGAPDGAGGAAGTGGAGGTGGSGGTAGAGGGGGTRGSGGMGGGP